MKLKILLLLLILLSGKITIAQDSQKTTFQTDSAWSANQNDIKKILNHIFGSKKSNLEPIKIIQTERDFIMIFSLRDGQLLHYGSFIVRGDLKNFLENKE